MDPRSPLQQHQTRQKLRAWLIASVLVAAQVVSYFGLQAVFSSEPGMRIGLILLAQADDASQRARGEALGRAASEKFDNALEHQKGAGESAVSPPHVINQSTSGDTDGPFARALDWLRSSAKTYEDVIVRALSTPGDGTDKIAETAGKASDTGSNTGSKRADMPPPTAEAGGPFWSPVYDWLDKASRDYQTAVVRQLSVPNPNAPPPEALAETANKPGEPEPLETTELPPGMSGAAVEAQRAAEAKAKDVADARNAEARAQKAAEDATKTEADSKTVAEERRRAEDAQASDARKAAEDFARRQREEKDVADAAAQRKAQEDADRKAIEAALVETERKSAEALKSEQDRKAADALKAASAKRAAEDLARRQREEKEVAVAALERRAKEDAKRKAEDNLKAETARKAEAERVANEKRLKAEADAKRADEARLAAEQAIAADDARKRLEAKTKSAARDREQVATATSPDGSATAAKPHYVPIAPQATVDPIAPQSPPNTKKSLAAVAKPEDARQRSDVEPSIASVSKAHKPRKLRAGKTHVRLSQNHRSRRYRRGNLYVVRPGDTLWRIARRYSVPGKKYRALARANRGLIRDPDMIYPRQKIHIPRHWR